MRSFPFKLEEIRPFVRPATEYALWPAAFVIMRALSWEPFYLLGLVLLLAADLIESPRKNNALFRDTVAGALTVLLAGIAGDLPGLAIGSVVTVSSLALVRRTPA